MEEYVGLYAAASKPQAQHYRNNQQQHRALPARRRNEVVIEVQDPSKMVQNFNHTKWSRLAHNLKNPSSIETAASGVQAFSSSFPQTWREVSEIGNGWAIIAIGPINKKSASTKILPIRQTYFSNSHLHFTEKPEFGDYERGWLMNFLNL